MLGLLAHRSAYHFHLCAPSSTLFCQRTTHFAAAVVANEAHGVNLFVCGTRCNHDALSLEVLGVSGKRLGYLSQYFLGFFHASFSLQVACQESGLRLNDVVAVRLQQGKVVLRGGVGIHVEVHCRRHKHGSLHGEIGGDEHVVRNAVGHLANGAGCGRSDYHGVGPKTQVYVAVPCAVSLAEELAYHRLACKCAQRDGGDELLSRRCDDHLHLGSLLDEAADEQAGLVCRNAACYSEYDFLTV